MGTIPHRANTTAPTWSAVLPSQAPSANPRPLTLKTEAGAGAATVHHALSDVVVGNVILFSGQSNIDLPQSYAHQVYTPSLPGCQPLNDSNRLCSSFNASAQKTSEQFADEYGHGKGLLRLMIVPSTHYNTALPAAELLEYPDCPLCPFPTTPYVACGCSSMQWARANASNIRGFSATAWFTGSSLMQQLEQLAASHHGGVHPGAGIPVGLLRSSMGGTQINLWASPEALAPCGPVTNPGFWQPYSALWFNMIWLVASHRIGLALDLSRRTSRLESAP